MIRQTLFLFAVLAAVCHADLNRLRRYRQVLEVGEQQQQRQTSEKKRLLLQNLWQADNGGKEEGKIRGAPDGFGERALFDGPPTTYAKKSKKGGKMKKSSKGGHDMSFSMYYL